MIDWQDYPAIKQGIKFYKYTFSGIKKPVIIEATNNKVARHELNELLPDLPADYRSSIPIDESVTIPIIGISRKKMNGKKYTWIGIETIKGGWIESDKYKKS